MVLYSTNLLGPHKRNTGFETCKIYAEPGFLSNIGEHIIFAAVTFNDRHDRLQRLFIIVSDNKANLLL